LAFLASAKDLLLRSLGDWLREGPSAVGADPSGIPAILIAEPVPMPMVRLAGRERAQLLLESPSRPLLQAMLGHYLPALRVLSVEHSRVHWHLEVDPLAI
jgi:primosomal protein N' (replication factor Y)